MPSPLHPPASLSAPGLSCVTLARLAQKDINQLPAKVFYYPGDDRLNIKGGLAFFD